MSFFLLPLGYCRLKPIRWLDMYFVANVLCICAINSEGKLDQ